MQALIVKELDSRLTHGRSMGACPTCRTPIDMHKPGEVIPMLFKVEESASSGAEVEDRPQGGKGKGKERATQKSDGEEGEKSETGETDDGGRAKKRKREH
jgi:hypothetical protein